METINIITILRWKWKRLIFYKCIILYLLPFFVVYQDFWLAFWGWIWSWFAHLSSIVIIWLLHFNDDVWVYSSMFLTILVLYQVYQASFIHHCMLALHSVDHDGFHQSYGKFEGHLMRYPVIRRFHAQVLGEIVIALVEAVCNACSKTCWWMTWVRQQQQ